MPHPWRDALIELLMSGSKHLSGGGRMLPVQTASAGLSAGQGMDLLAVVATTSREKREQRGKSTFAKSRPLIYRFITQRSKTRCGQVALSHVLGH